MRRLRSFWGVFVPSLTTALGTVLILFLPRITDHGGFLLAGAIIVLAHALILTTGFSLADCATNLHHLEGNGLYPLVRMSMGNALGGTIGILLYFSQALSAGFFCLAFASLLHGLPLTEQILTPLTQDPVLQLKILASGAMIVLALVTLTGFDFAGKGQLPLFVALVSALGLFVVVPLTRLRPYNGYAPGISIRLTGLSEIDPALFFPLFLLYFPAVTGLTSGINRSGDLLNHRRSLVNGVFWVILTTLMISLVGAFLYSSVEKGTETVAAYLRNPVLAFPLLFLTGVSFINHFRAAPFTAQALAADKNIPQIPGLYTSKKVPRGGMLITLVPVLALILLTDLEKAARCSGLLFLSLYAWLNAGTFLERFCRNPGFRPTFRNHWLISLVGLAGCLVLLFLSGWLMASLLITIQMGIFLLLLKFRSEGRLEGIIWGLLNNLSTRSLLILRKILQSTRTWRPVVDVIAFEESGNWEAVADLAARIAMRNGLVRLNLIRSPRKPESAVLLSHLKIPAGIVETSDPVGSIQTLVQGCHIGGVETNTVLLDYNGQLDNLRLLKSVIMAGKNILLMVNGYKFRNCETLDIWWRGERNGNLMVHLAFILNRSLQEQNTPPFRIRLIRRLDMHEEAANAREALEKLLKMARLPGEVVVLPCDDTPFYKTLERVSLSASLIMMGLPGNFMDRDSERIRLFNLDEFFFTREIHNFDRLPPLLFIKSARSMTLTTD